MWGEEEARTLIEGPVSSEGTGTAVPVLMPQDGALLWPALSPSPTSSFSGHSWGMWGRCSVSGPRRGGRWGSPLHMHSRHWSHREQQWELGWAASPAHRRKGLVLGAGGPGGIMGGRPGPPPRGEMYVGGAPGTGGPGLSRSWFRVSVAGGAGWKGLVTEGPVAGAPAERRQRYTEQSGGSAQREITGGASVPALGAILTTWQEGVGGLGSLWRGARPAHQRIQVDEGRIRPQERFRCLPRGRRGGWGICGWGAPHSLGQRAPDPSHVERPGTAGRHLSSQQLQLPWRGRGAQRKDGWRGLGKEVAVPGSRAQGQNPEGLRPRDKGHSNTDKFQSSDWGNYSNGTQQVEGR